MQKQRISYVDPETITNPDMRAELERCRVLVLCEDLAVRFP